MNPPPPLTGREGCSTIGAGAATTGTLVPTSIPALATVAGGTTVSEETPGSGTTALEVHTTVRSNVSGVLETVLETFVIDKLLRSAESFESSSEDDENKSRLRHADDTDIWSTEQRESSSGPPNNASHHLFPTELEPATPSNQTQSTTADGFDEAHLPAMQTEELIDPSMPVQKIPPPEDDSGPPDESVTPFVTGKQSGDRLQIEMAHSLDCL